MADPIRAALEQAANELDIAENALLCSSFHNAASRAKQAAMTARAAIAADRAQRQPVPPEPEDVQELVEWLRELGAKRGGVFDVSTFCANLTRAAELLSQRHPQPVPVSERQPEPADLSDEKIEAIFDKHGQYVYDSEEDMGAKVIFWGDFKTAAREIESASPVTAPHQPVPVSERWPEFSHCDKAERVWCWSWAIGTWRLSRINQSIHSHWLPAHALPLPGEVEG